MTDLHRIMRIFRHLLRNIESTAMPVSLARIEAELGIAPRHNSPDAGRPIERKAE